MVPFEPWMAAMRPKSIPIDVMVFVWNDHLYQVLEFQN
jgi:hypothetical protein